MLRRVRWIVMAVVLGVLAAVGAYWWSYYTSPRYALHQMVLALKDKDMDRLFNYLDLKEIMKGLIAPATQELSPPEDPEEDEWSRLGRRLGQKLAKQVLPRVVENFEEQIRTVLKHYLETLDNTKILALGAAVSLAKIQVQGEEALVTVKEPTKGETYRFTMRRRLGERRWRIVGVNYDDFKKILKHELL